MAFKSYNRVYISEDPIGFAAGDYNFYRMAANNPQNSVDPLGLEQCKDRDKCIKECLKNNYGKSAEIAKDLSIIGLASSISHFALHALPEAITYLSEIASKAAETKWARILSTPISEIDSVLPFLKRSEMASKAANMAAKFKSVSAYAHIAGRISVAATVGASAYYATAYGYCWLECR